MKRGGSLGAALSEEAPGYSTELSKAHHHFTWEILEGHSENQAAYERLPSADPLDDPYINSSTSTKSSCGNVCEGCISE